MVNSSVFQSASQSRFLIIGCDDKASGDGAAASAITNVVEGWQLPSVETMVVSRLNTNHTIALSRVDYVIFIDASSGQDKRRSLRVQPITGNFQLEEIGSDGAEAFSPRSLLNLTLQSYGESPLAWLIELPAACTASDQSLSAAAHAGCDRALRTIAQFLRTYQKPNYLIQDRPEAPREIHPEALNCA
ncbi:MAG: hypothetical protein AAFR18_16660 [Cyanobacteria bacterium J06627_32]